MPPELLLFLLRIVSAGLLLGFFVVLGWMLLREMQLTSRALAEQQRSYGGLRVIATDGAEPAVGASFPLLPVTSIGRSPGNTIVLPHSYTSNEHALITRRGQQWWLEDLGSRNGTLLNDAPLVEAAVVSPGDVITIGATQLKLEM